jgi:serine palmitoyltransferase
MYLEKPFVQTKSTIKHSEFGHCNNPNWRWTSQVSTNTVVARSKHADRKVEPR